MTEKFKNNNKKKEKEIGVNLDSWRLLNYTC